MQVPEYLITTKETPEKVQRVDFSELYELKERIAKMIMLWDNNSYIVDAVSKSFIINGGRKLLLGDHFPGAVQVLYARRNKKEISFAGEQVGQTSISYLLGFESLEDKKQMLLHISPDGMFYKFVEHR